MRWLVVHPGPHFSVHDVYAGWVEALQALGQTVIGFPLGDVLTFYECAHIGNSDDGTFRKALTADQVQAFAADRLAATLFKTRPDVLLAVSAFFTDPRLLQMARQQGTRVVLLHTESPYEDGRQLEIAEHADLNLLNDPTHIHDFEAVAPTVYAPHAYRPTVHRPGPGRLELASDLAFSGTGFPSRVDFFTAMNLDGLTVRLAGNWMLLKEDSPLRGCVVHPVDECYDNEDTVTLYQSAKTGLNLYRREAEAEHLADGWSMGPREVEMAACGLFFLRDPRGESDEVLGMLPSFTGPEDASEQLRWWLIHDAPRETLAAKARRAVEGRTFENHAAKLLRLFDRQSVTV